MSTIYLDPVAMDATAGAIGEHAKEVDVAIGDLETACAAEVPPSLAGWLTDELRDIAVHARLAELVYVVAALETAVRAQQIQADQSLATAIPGVGAPAPATGFVLDVDPVFDPSGNGYVLNTGPFFHPVTSGTYSGGVAPSGGSRLVEEQTMTLQLIRMEAVTGANANRSMSRY
jgi:hypothetical protein